MIDGPVADIPARHPPGQGVSTTGGVAGLDADLRRAVRHASAIRQCFYLVVLLVALAGQVTGAVQALHIPPLWAVPAVAALELGGVVVLANADVRRRLGERATASRLLSTAIAAGAVTFNWLAHPDHLHGGFFAGMSTLGYLIWLTHAENQRRDRLRATGQLPPTTPAYEPIAHWLRHPSLTHRARTLAKAHPDLGLYDSLAAARNQIRYERRQRAISAVLHRKIRSAVDPSTADIAVAVYDLDQIATRLADHADYDTLTALIATDLTPDRLTTATNAPNGHHTNNPRAAEGTEHVQTGGPPDQAPAELSTRPAAPQTTAPPEPPHPPGAGAAASAQPPDTSQHLVHTATAGSAPPAYQPTNSEDTAMYQTWRRGVAAAREPSGAELARAAGRANDATGIGRRAARRYRQAHAHDVRATPPDPTPT